MKKLSRIFLTIGGVFHIVGGATYLTLAVVYLVVGIIALAGGGIGLFEYIQQYAGDDAAAYAGTISAMVVGIVYIVLSVLFVGFGIVSFIAAKVTFRARNEGGKPNFVASIVFGAIFEVKFAIAGAILGIIAANKEKPVEEAPAEEATEVVE